MRIKPVFIAFFILASCSDSSSIQNPSGINTANTELGNAQMSEHISNSRVIVIDSTNDTSSLESALNGLRAAGQGLTIPPDPIVQTVLPNGTILVDLGNRFARPLFATVDCNGNIKSSHSSTGTIAINSCQSQRGKKQ
jgi:hypothetical protein